MPTYSYTERVCARLLRQMRLGENLTRPELGRRIGRPPELIYRLETCRQRLWVVDYFEMVKGLEKDPVESTQELILRLSTQEEAR